MGKMAKRPPKQRRAICATVIVLGGSRQDEAPANREVAPGVLAQKT